jgi:nitrogen-specific signal transduction histidine kinase
MKEIKQVTRVRTFNPNNRDLKTVVYKLSNGEIGSDTTSDHFLSAVANGAQDNYIKALAAEIGNPLTMLTNAQLLERLLAAAKNVKLEKFLVETANDPKIGVFEQMRQPTVAVAALGFD